MTDAGKPRQKDVIHSKIWQEIPEPDNPFAAQACYCSGFDVYGDLLGKVSWVEYLYLLFKLEPPSKTQTKLLEGVAVALANPGPRDLSVRAAMSGGAGGSIAASCLIGALGPGSGQYGGAREMFLAIRLINTCGKDLAIWQDKLTNYEKQDDVKAWPDIEHIPGFDPYGSSCSTPVKQTLDYLSSIEIGEAGQLQWLKQNRESVEGFSGNPLAMVGVIAAAFIDLGFTDEQAEMLFMILRLPGAGAHALEQRHNGLAKYPFFADGLKLSNDPGPVKDNLEKINK